MSNPALALYTLTRANSRSPDFLRPNYGVVPLIFPPLLSFSLFRLIPRNRAGERIRLCGMRAVVNLNFFLFAPLV